MDLGVLGHVSFDADFYSGLLSIIIVNIILSGDNAVVIALAVRSLPRSQCLKGIIFGSAAAVLLRIVLTFFAAQMLQISFLKLGGGVLIAWIAVKLFLDDSGGHAKSEDASNFAQAIRIILIADLVMSLDNVLAVAGASKGNLFLLSFGLAMSIPIVVGTSSLLSRLMDKYPIIIYIGAAVLGKVAGEMIITDPIVIQYLNLNIPVQYLVEAVFTIGVVVLGKLIKRWKNQKSEAAVVTPEI